MPIFCTFFLYKFTFSFTAEPGPLVQLVGSLNADPGVGILNPTRPHIFVEIDHEIFSSVIFLAVVSYKQKHLH